MEARSFYKVDSVTGLTRLDLTFTLDSADATPCVPPARAWLVAFNLESLQ